MSVTDQRADPPMLNNIHSTTSQQLPNLLPAPAPSTNGRADSPKSKTIHPPSSQQPTKHPPQRPAMSVETSELDLPGSFRTSTSITNAADLSHSSPLPTPTNAGTFTYPDLSHQSASTLRMVVCALARSLVAIAVAVAVADGQVKVVVKRFSLAVAGGRVKVAVECFFPFSAGAGAETEDVELQISAA
ncbi:hypothetical protein BAUCODRAFT_332947 [Baudoinia panamericana UAMH 10762]|uniref:Uncharacterized protein n=1 Tax=Baudoinia panamericana (strain UAMH 10762) TaxID=717646 RepID=M2MIB1_BAUPA|nr:uncharacterized protein BAUCODRAFT_332947 [Baudoinia panamericana UAMH 10762]EMC90993.1 hypothetical protein BAUCODRAFT_332947 [Baudoinia panamericana UAMH 10762]